MATVSKSQLHFIPIDLEEDDSWLSPGLQVRAQRARECFCYGVGVSGRCGRVQERSPLEDH